MHAIRVPGAGTVPSPVGSPSAGETPQDYSHETLAGYARAPPPLGDPTVSRNDASLSARRHRPFPPPRASRRVPSPPLTPHPLASPDLGPAPFSRLAMDLRSSDPATLHAAVVHLRRLAVRAEGPGAPFTATPRGHQLLRLIHVVVQNVGLEDKVGALTALRLLKADDTLIQKLLKEGVLPPLLAVLRDRAREEERGLDDDALPESNESDALVASRTAETAAAAARCLQAFSSSADASATLLRGGAVEALSAYVARRRGEVAKEARDDERGASPSPSPAAELRAAATASCVAALARVSGSYLDASDGPSACEAALSAPDGTPNGDGTPKNDGTPPSAAALDPVAAASALSAARSLLRLVSSDVVVCHREAAAGLARLTKSGRAGRAAVAQCGAVLPLMTAALKGDAKQRAAAMAALGALAEGDPSNDPDPRARRSAALHDAPFEKGSSMDVEGDDEDEDEDEDEDDRMDDDVDDIDDASGVHDAAAASSIARRAESAKAAAVNAAANARARRTKGSEDGGGGRNAVVLGTAAKVGETFFARLIAVLASLVRLRGPLARAAADASLALWALAWQPSNRAAMVRDVVEPLVDLYAEARHPKKAKAPQRGGGFRGRGGGAFGARAGGRGGAARDRDGGARRRARGGGTLGARGRDEPGAEPQGRRGRRGGTRNAGVRPRTGGSRGEEKAQRRGDVAEHSAHHKQRPRLRRVGERRPEMTRPRERVERGRARERPFESRPRKKTPFGLTDGPFSRVASRDVRGRTLT